MKYPEIIDPMATFNRDEVFDKLREDDPVFFCDHDLIRAWLTTSYDDTLSFFKDDRLQFSLMFPPVPVRKPVLRHDCTGLAALSVVAIIRSNPVFKKH